MPSTETPSLPSRLSSIDAYRGFVMLLMMGEVLRLRAVALANSGNAFWAFLADHQQHVEWVGCSLHDLIQPSFSFLVGVALPFSLASRVARGQSRAGLLAHAAWRAVVLVWLGIFLRSIHSRQTNYTFEDTLTQIGLGYFFLFLLGLCTRRVQWGALALILAGYWLAFALYPIPGTGFDYQRVQVPSTWHHQLQGFAAHWNKNSNAAWAFDAWFLNLLPREKPFIANNGGYSTLSFIPTLATMILGLLAGGVMRGERSPRAKLAWLATAGVVCLGLGYGAGWLGVCPVVKRIWTPSWVLFSGGWCFLILAAFYAVVDALGWKRWAFPLIVVGMNSIAAYCLADLARPFVLSSLTIHLGHAPFLVFGPAFEPLLQGAAALLVFWLILFWMYRRKIFIRI